MLVLARITGFVVAGVAGVGFDKINEIAGVHACF
jgi:hypothetical protein